MKFLLVAIIMTMFNTILLQVSDSFWNNAVAIIIALGTFVTVLVAAIIKLLTFLKSIKTEVSGVKNEVVTVKTEVETVKKSINGLLEQKSKAERALGVLEGIEDAEKEDAIGNKRELQILKEQALKNEIPPSQHNRDSDLKKAQDKIVETLETEIHKKGEEMKKVVENKSDQIKDEVKEVPTKTADEVVDKLKPPAK